MRVYADANPNQRKGQAAFNYLYIVRPELADSIRTTIFDPFYNDNKLEIFIDYIERMWYDNECQKFLEPQNKLVKDLTQENVKLKIKYHILKSVVIITTLIILIIKYN